MTNSRYFCHASIYALIAALGCLGCGRPEPVEACIKLEANPNLNSFDRQPHATTLYLYPLTQRLGFEQTGVDDLLEGKDPPGAAAQRVSVVVNPGEQRVVRELFPDNTVFIGIVADYYRAPGSQEGSRKVVLEARCGWGQSTVVLTPRDMLIN